MIDISGRLTQEKKDFHFNGFYNYVKTRFYRSRVSHRINPKYNIEKKFYRSLLLNTDFAKSIIFSDINELIILEDRTFYKKNRLFFLLCMGESARNLNPFSLHLKKELKNLPRDVAKDLALYGINKVSEQIRSRCEKIFNYNKFIRVNKKTTNETSIWNAYNYISEFTPKVCPYCNFEITTNLEKCLNNNKVKYILRPALDHFLPQSLFPFYSLSVNNLVPCCHTCNSSLKKDVDFMKERHISPMGESFKTKAQFGISLKNSDLILNAIDDIYNENKINTDNFEIIIESKCAKVNRNVRTFEILMRYNNHPEMYSYFLNNIPKVRPENIKATMAFFDVLSEDEAIQELLQFDANEQKHCDTPLSILKQDLIKRYVST